jgi:orotate phosphoribosyltransferase
MDEREQLIDDIRERGVLRLDEPVELASGAMSREFVDVKAALAQGDALARACRAMVALAERRGADFDVVGGLTMGADQFAYGIAVLTGDREWFVVRKQAKGRGTAKRIEGADIEGRRALLVEDAVSTGGSLLDACRIVRDAGAEVVLATTVVDRGEVARSAFAAEDFPNEPLLTYGDVGLAELVVPPSGNDL